MGGGVGCEEGFLTPAWLEKKDQASPCPFIRGKSKKEERFWELGFARYDGMGDLGSEKGLMSRKIKKLDWSIGIWGYWASGEGGGRGRGGENSLKT